MQRKLLIADDEVHIRMLLEQTLEDLEDEGIELLQARNGEEAVEIIRTERPRLVFLDYNMPILTGVDVCHHIKKELGMTDVYIVLLTGKGQDTDRKEGLSAGADRYLTKPFDPGKVLDLAGEIFEL
ncbi:MAG: response regulator [Saprospiraceae bacterium]|nr:response regulator [Saprospiraceae bacterium]